MTDNEFNSILRDIDVMLASQLVNVKGDTYMHGMYNGMEFIRSMITKTEPLYVDKDGGFDMDEIARNPERFI